MGSGEVGSLAHEQLKAAIHVRIAELQRETAREALRWAKLSSVATAASSVLAVVALLIAVLA